MTIHLQVFTLLVVFDINSKPCNIDLYYKSFNFIERGNFKALWDLLTFLYPYYIYRHILPKLKRKIKYIKMWDITRTWTWHKDSLEKSIGWAIIPVYLICNVIYICGVFQRLLLMISYTNWIDSKFQDRLPVHESNCCLDFFYSNHFIYW